MFLFVDFHFLHETSEEGKVSTRLSSIRWQVQYLLRPPARRLLLEAAAAVAGVVSSRMHLPSSCVLALGNLVVEAKASIRMKTRSFFAQIASCSAEERKRSMSFHAYRHDA